MCHKGDEKGEDVFKIIKGEEINVRTTKKIEGSAAKGKKK